MGCEEEPLWRQSINHMLHFSFALKAEIEAKLGAEIGIGLADHEALINIRLSDEEMRMSDLADRLVVSRGGVTKLVDRLETAGYVRREPSADDRRVTIVAITPQGIETVTESRRLIDEILVARWANRITGDEAQFVKDLVRRAFHEEKGALVDE